MQLLMEVILRVLVSSIGTSCATCDLLLRLFVQMIDQFSPYYLIDAIGCFQKI